ncbi:anthranilate phosphoribosyltransferase [Quadrisphaera granulorum]|uniref:Anthranilate phosphoribosyltransferase n=1 Tax=Quadrisphaera granulorum TaxID=317664 RepID=A0A315ZX52_9ACTN|nr:anthranilate phosphoribosyltransferase [Quadrisphaera granulorum]PWJ49879.1 anthranilate phosphoribosyltransferase [Quadrisphaera granulorum]SZE98087.1 anthranilate phosphoribosyltransferase [Quadrisphaera granulorum]
MAVVGAQGARTWQSLISSLVAGRDLTAQDCAWAMARVMAGEAPAVPLAGFLVALRAKGETVEELSGLADEMLAHAVPLTLPPAAGPAEAAVDIVGTGGDRSVTGTSTVNISTMAALVVAGAGRTVVKHGNRAASSLCGSADLLEELGVRLDLPPARVGELAGEVGITFAFARVFHPAFRHAAEARSGLGVPTAFNVLGPMTNPGRPGAAAVGVADARLAPLVAGVLVGRGTRALVFRGDDGLDELTTSGPSRAWRAGAAGTVEEVVVDPAALDLPPSSLSDLAGGDAPHNAAIARAVLAGKPGPVRDAVLLNAAAALVAADGLHGDLHDDLRAQLAVAAASVDSGAAAAVLERWVAATGS